MPYTDPKWSSIIRMADKDTSDDPYGFNDRAHLINDAHTGLAFLKYGDDRPPGIGRPNTRNGGRKSKSNKKAHSRRRKISKKSQTKRRK